MENGPHLEDDEHDDHIKGRYIYEQPRRTGAATSRLPTTHMSHVSTENPAEMLPAQTHRPMNDDDEMIHQKKDHMNEMKAKL